MERRHFIRWTGVELSSLLFTRWDAHTAPRELILPPARVMAGLDDGWHELVSRGQDIYTYRDVTVRLKNQDAAVGKDAAIGVEVESPTQALQFIRLQWGLPQPNWASVLGDH